jgi:hypothetical protein
MKRAGFVAVGVTANVERRDPFGTATCLVGSLYWLRDATRLARVAGRGTHLSAISISPPGWWELKSNSKELKRRISKAGAYILI